MASPTRKLCLALALAALLACAGASSRRGDGKKDKNRGYKPPQRPPPLRCSPSVCTGHAIVGIPNYARPPYWFTVGGIQTGFGRNVMEAICEGAGLQCKVLPMALADMIPSVLNGTVDFVVSTLSATAERATVVDFSKPGFYSAGATLYTSPDQAAIIGDWEGARGRTICIANGYYATADLVATYGIVPLTVVDFAAGISAAKAGTCEGFAADSGQPTSFTDGLVQVPGAQPFLTTAYAIPVKQGRRDLRLRITAVMTEILEQGLDASRIFDWEAFWLTSAGIPELPSLREVVSAIADFV